MKYKAIRNLWLREEDKYIVRGQEVECDRAMSERFDIHIGEVVEAVIEEMVSPVVQKEKGSTVLSQFAFLA